MKRTIQFPDGRTAIVETKENRREVSVIAAEVQAVKDFLKVGVSRKWIAHHLRLPQEIVDYVSDDWKKNELPNILRERAARGRSSA